MSSLYELTANWQEVRDMADDPEVDPQTVEDTIEAIDGEIEYKMDGYCRVLADLQGEADAIREEEKRLANKRHVIENNVERMKNRMMFSMKETGKTKINTPLFTVSVQKAGRAPVELDCDVDDLPEDMTTTKRVPDMEAIRNYVEATDNTCEFAHIGEQKTILRIR